jgi:flagellar hook-associated protein 3 FlgL
MRISTSQYFGMNVQTMDDQQATLSQLYQQLSTGVSLSTPSDNPVGAAQAVQLSMQASTLSQYSSNQSTALSSLQSEDSTLSSVSSVLTNINTLMVRAGDSSLSDSNRSAIATQLQGLRNQLMGLANSTDGSGNYLFAGFQSSTMPFSVGTSGAVQYNGDNGVQNVQVSSTRNIATGDTGAQVFLSVGAPGTSSVPSASAGNTGSGTIGSVATTNAGSASNLDKYSIVFTSPTAYTVTDVTAGTAPVAGTYTAGTAIPLGGGQSVAISGAPALNDSFTVAPATQSGTDVFANIDAVVSALQTPVVGATGAANLSNALTTGMSKLANTLNNVVTIQASVGGRENEIQALQAVTQSNSLQTQSNLADVTSIDPTQVISKYTMTQYALQAAQQGFTMIQKMSLFNYIGN